MRSEVLETAFSGVRLPGMESWVASFGAADSNASAIHTNQFPIRASNTERQLRLLYGVEQSLPAIATNQDCYLLFDGRLHNRDSLLEELQGDIVPDATDAAVVLQAYLEFGRDFLLKIRGIFALIVWDIKRNSLFAARDPLGVYPLFHTRTGQEWLFCSSIDPMLRHPYVSRTLNRARLADHLCSRWLSIDETYYENIHRIPPGHLLLISDSGTQLHRYWDPVASDRDISWVTEEAFERFDSCFERAVDRCLQVGPSGIFLSGGLDSVSVASVATDITRRKGDPLPFAMSLIFPHPECNEEAVQRDVAQQLGIQQYLIPLEQTYSQNGLLESAVEMEAGWQSPLLTPWRPSYLRLAQEACTRNCNVIMTGGGGDEWLTVVPTYAADLMRDGDLQGLYQLTRNLMRSHRLNQWSMFRFILWQSGLRKLIGFYASRVFKETIRAHRFRKIRNLTHDWIAPDVQLRREIDARIEAFVAQRMQRPDPIKHHGFYFSNMPDLFVRPFWSIEMEEEFEMGRRLGTWLLSPYRDSELVDLLLHIPPKILQSGGREKGMVRQSVARRFPNLRFEKQRKVDAIAFLRSVIRSEAPRIWGKMGGVRSLIELGIVNSERMDSILESSLSSNFYPDNYRIYELLILEAWVRARL